MTKNFTESYFSKKHYPVFLIISGLFVFFFPLEWLVEGSYAFFYIHLGIAFALLVPGIVLYLKKKKECQDQLRSKIKKLAIVVGVTIAVFFLAAVIIGAVLGVSSALNSLAPTIPTSRIDIELLETRVLDWVNQQRAKNAIHGINLDNNLLQLAKIRTLQITEAELNERETIGNANATEIAKNEGLECIDDYDNPIPIMEYVVIMPHGEFREFERFVDFGMQQLVNNDEAREMVFASNVTRTGISAAVTNEHLFIIQNFC